jgi:hypothetical protein
MKGGGRRRDKREIEGVNMIKIYYLHVLKYHNEALSYS